MAGLLDYITNPVGTVGAGLLGNVFDYYRNMQAPQADNSGPQYDPMGSFTGLNVVPQTPAAPPSVFATGAPAFVPSPALPQPQPTAPSPPQPQLENPISVGGYQMPRIGNPDQYIPQQAMTPPNATPTQGLAPMGVQADPQALPPALGSAGSALGRIFNPDGLIARLTGNDSRSIAQQNLRAQYEALVPIVGPQKAMLAVLNPEAGKTILAQALEKQQPTFGVIGEADGGGKAYGFIDPVKRTVTPYTPQGSEGRGTVTGPDGKEIQIPPGVDAKTFRNEISRATADAITGKKTEVQGAAEQFANRMENAEKSFGKVGNEGLGLSGATQSAVGSLPGVGNFLKTENFQKMEQAKREWVTALLRKESGAAIGRDEYTQYDRQFFPQPGDGPGVVAQKAEARRTAVEALKKAAGPSYKSPSGNTTQSGVSWSIVQ